MVTRVCPQKLESLGHLVKAEAGVQFLDLADSLI